MKCAQAQDLLLSPEPGSDGSLQQRFAYEHLRSCAACRDAVHAAQVLRAEGAAVVPAPPDGAFERAMLAAARSASVSPPRHSSFWGGVAVGGALAAGIAAAALVIWSPAQMPAPADAMPIVSIAPNAARDISISLDAPEALDDAGIRVVLSGNIALAGYEGRRELSWSTRLERGTNRLTLPVVTLGPGGGQLLVEVASGASRKTFVVDVRADASI